MAVELLGILHWSADPARVVTGDAPTQTNDALLTMAGSYDASDSTYEHIVASDIGGESGGSTFVWVSQTLNSTFSGTCSYLLFKYRAKCGGDGGTADIVYKRGAGTLNVISGNVQRVLTSSYVDYTLGVGTNALNGDGLWTGADMTADQFGVLLGANCAGDSYGEAFLSEFTVEVWGTPDGSPLPTGSGGLDPNYFSHSWLTVHPRTNRKR